MLPILLSFLMSSPLRWATAETITCGPPGTIAIGGSESVEILAKTWKTKYEGSCPETLIEIEAGGSSAGAARVCGTRAHTTPVDIGGMTRNWNPVEAVTKNGWHYDCERSRRNAIQVGCMYDGVPRVVISF